MIFFTSDQHFGHENIIKHCNRPFKSADEMDQYMIDAWNSVVSETDIVYHLGDMSHKKCPKDRADACVEACNGRKVLIAGNHDTDCIPMKPNQHYTERMVMDLSLFEVINPGYHELFLEGHLVVLSHYAMETWHDMRKKTIHLHGHSHGKLTPKTRRLDVGVDTHDFKPWSWDEIKAKFKLTPVKSPVVKQEQGSLF